MAGSESGYFPSLSKVSNSLVQSGELGWWEVFGLQFIRSDISLDAALAKGSAPYPVVLFSPGNGTNIEFYSGIAGEIASHGYIVVGLNHPHDVAAIELSSGNVAPYDKDQWLTDGPLLQPSILPGPNEVDHMMNLMQKYTAAFLDQILKRQRNDLLSEAREQNDVSVRIYPSR